MILPSKKGQALIEFVIILPVFIFILFASIDIGKILTTKQELETKLEDVILAHKNHNTTEEIKKNLKLEQDKIGIEIEPESNQYLAFTLSKQVDIITPGLNLILGNPTIIKADRVVFHE